jgi:uncharacterized membrane protein YoaK (UPF0700 family)
MRTYLKQLADSERSDRIDRHLAFYLTFVAGAANAGGFTVVGQYTSHMSGVVSSIADNLVLDNGLLLLHGITALVAFLSGAATSAILINWARRRDLHSQYALPITLEAILLSLFAVTDLLPQSFATVAIIALLCYVMGLQNAMITKLSGARIRTTHVTGMVTDIGIELGKYFYINPDRQVGLLPPVKADLAKLGLLATMVSLFVIGGVCGALLFKTIGIPASYILAAPLFVIAAYPLIADARKYMLE